MEQGVIVSGGQPDSQTSRVGPIDAARAVEAASAYDADLGLLSELASRNLNLLYGGVRRSRLNNAQVPGPSCA